MIKRAVRFATLMTAIAVPALLGVQVAADPQAHAAGDAAGWIAPNLQNPQAAKDGNGLVKWGYAYVTLGQPDKGVELIEKGIAKGGLKRPEDAKLRLAQAQLAAGKKAKAQQTFHSVQGDDGAADIARLHGILAAQKSLS